MRFLTAVITAAIALSLVAHTVLAQEPDPGTVTPPAAQTPAAATPSGSVSIPNPIKCGDATCLIIQVIKYIFGIIAILATLMFVWGGVMMITSEGNAERVKRARETLTWAVIGIIVIMLSWAAITFVVKGLGVQ